MPLTFCPLSPRTTATPSVLLCGLRDPDLGWLWPPGSPREIGGGCLALQGTLGASNGQPAEHPTLLLWRCPLAKHPNLEAGQGAVGLLCSPTHGVRAGFRADTDTEGRPQDPPPAGRPCLWVALGQCPRLALRPGKGQTQQAASLRADGRRVAARSDN